MRVGDCLGITVSVVGLINMYVLSVCDHICWSWLTWNVSTSLVSHPVNLKSRARQYRALRDVLLVKVTNCPFWFKGPACMAGLSSYRRKGRRAWEKYPICLGLPLYFLLFVAPSQSSLFSELWNNTGWEEQSLWDSASPTSRSYKLFTISFSFLALYGKVQWVSFPFSFIHHSSQLGIVEGQLPGLPLTETLQICLK